MPIFFASIDKNVSATTDTFVDIPGLVLTLPKAGPQRKEALVTLNIPKPFADGTNFPGVDFSIRAGANDIAVGGFTYPMQVPPGAARSPFTLIGRVILDANEHTHIKAMWRSVRGCQILIDSYAAISAIVE